MAEQNNRQETNKAQGAVDEQTKAKIGEGIQKLFGPKQVQHKAIIKSLEDLGVRVRVMPIMLGDQPTSCLVIPVDELIAKEYAHMSGVDLSKYAEQSTEENATHE